MNNTVLSTTFVANDKLTPALNKMSDSLTNLNRQFTTVQNTMEREQNINAFKGTKIGIDEANNSLLASVGSTNRLTSAINMTSSAVKGLMLSFLPLMALTSAVSFIIGSSRAVDQYTQLTARLNLMNDGLQTTTLLNDKIYASAQRARGGYIEMADSVAKLGILAGQAFNSNDEMISFVEQLNKQFKIAGASAEESKSAMYQLTQAMASGRLQGDEFRSVMENAPLLAKAISKEMGIPMGQLKQMASEGAITADVIKRALINSAEETNEYFKQIPMTFSDMAIMLGNVSKKAFQPIYDSISRISTTDGFQAFLGLLANGINGIAVVAEGAFSIIEGIFNTIAFIADVAVAGLSVLFGIVESTMPLLLASLGAYLAYLTYINAESILNATVTALQATWQGILSAKTMITVGATNALSVAQAMLNTIMSLNPIGIVVMLLGFLIGAVVGASVATNGLRETMASAWSSMVTIAGTAINRIIDMVNGLISVLNSVGGTLGKVFNFEYNGIAKISHVDTSGIAKGGADFIRNFDINNLMKIPSMGGGAELTNIGGSNGVADALNNIGDNTGRTAGNTSKIADAVDSALEDMEQLRALAEVDGVNNITKQEIKLDIVNHNTVNSDMDLDGIGDKIGNILINTIAVSREGV